MNPFLMTLAGLALLLFWAVGAYNRLVRLRAAVVHAFDPFDQGLTRRLDWVQQALPELLRDLDLDAASAPWARVQAAGQQVKLAQAQVRRKPGDRAAMAGLVLARTTLEGVWQEALTSPAEPLPDGSPLLLKWTEWQHAEAPLAVAFDQAVGVYNAAAAQFPASVLARLSGLPLAGALAPPGPHA